MSSVDIGASLAFGAFVGMEWFLDGHEEHTVLYARLAWLTSAILVVLVAYSFEKPANVGVSEAIAAKSLDTENGDDIRADTSVESPSNIHKATNQEVVVDQEREVPITPVSPTTRSETSANMTPLSAESAIMSEGSVKRRKSLFKRTVSLFSPSRRSMSAKAQKATETSPSALTFDASATAAEAASTMSVSPDVEPKPANVESTEHSNSVFAVDDSSKKIFPDEFGFGPEAPRPASSFEYTNPNPWGYAGNLDANQQKALDELRSRNLSCIESRDSPPRFIVNDETLLRFLRARKFDVDKAGRMLESHLAWRDKFLPSRLTPNDIAGVLGSGLARFGPYSKTGLPVTMIKVEYYDPSKFEGDVDLFTRYVAFFFERAVTRLPKGGDKGLLFFDMKGWSLRRHATKFSLKLIAELINIIQAHNPERLEKCILFNTPLIFSGTWAIIKVLIDPVVAGKIQFVSDTRVMLDLFDKEVLPIEYGGTRDLPYPIEGFAELHTAK